MAKGEQTRREIVNQAYVLAGTKGLEGVTLGTLADRMGLSKSGLFAHFKSKEALQLEVLQSAIDRFVAQVVLPALTKARGLPRLRSLFELYLDWIAGAPGKGSCFFMTLTQEYDDRPGPLRDLLVQSQREWQKTIARVARTAIEEGHFARQIDADQVAYEVVGIGMIFQQSHKLLEDSRARLRARRAFDALLTRCRLQPAA
jgi:AcrR family transcriptional regulator